MLEVVPLSQADLLPSAPRLAPVEADVPLADQMVAWARRAGLAQPEAIVDAAIDELQCEDLLDRVPRPMSRGELQICALLITLSAPVPALSVVDPTAGLDGRRSRVVADMFVALGDHGDVYVASDSPGFTVLLPWQPLTVAEVAGLFADAPLRWFITGGYALELHLGERYREHSDIDVGIVRHEAQVLPHVLPGWDIQVAAAGALTSWAGGPLDADRSQNNLWCRPEPSAPFCLDITIGEGDAESWVYRRDLQVRRPWAEAVLTDHHGVPYLAPELQLLFKSNAPRPKDTLDATTIIPSLDRTQRTFLAQRLPSGHPWQALTEV